jgi:hypothetical protein
MDQKLADRQKTYIGSFSMGSGVLGPILILIFNNLLTTQNLPMVPTEQKMMKSNRPASPGFPTGQQNGEGPSTSASVK